MKETIKLLESISNSEEDIREKKIEEMSKKAKAEIEQAILNYAGNDEIAFISYSTSFTGGSVSNDSDGISNDAEGNFDALWTILDEHYTFFEYKNVDWDAVGKQYRAITQLTPCPLIASGACSREDPQPKLSPPTMISPSFSLSLN